MTRAKLFFLLAGAFNTLLGYMAYQVNFVELRANTAMYTLSRLGLLALAALFVVTLRRVRLDGFALLLAWLFVQGTLVGLAHGFAMDGIVRHAAATAFILFVYLVGLNATTYPSEAMMTTICWITIASFGLGFLALRTLLAASDNVTAGLSSGPLLLPLAWALVRRRWNMGLIAAFLIAIGIKRGVILGAGALLFVYLLKMQAGRRVRRYAVFSGVLVVATLLVSLSVQLLPYLPYLSGTIERFSRFGSSGDIAITFITSGRDRELAGVQATLESVAGGYWIGAGHGATYTFEFFSWVLRELVVFDGSQPDVAVIYLLLLYGAPMAALAVFLLGRRLWAAVNRHAGGGAEAAVPIALTLFVVGYIVDMALSFVPNNPMYWLALGLVGAPALARPVARHAKTTVGAVGARMVTGPSPSP